MNRDKSLVIGVQPHTARRSNPTNRRRQGARPAVRVVRALTVARRRVRCVSMQRLFGSHGIIGWLTLAVAVFAVLGHVCVVPHEAHAVTDAGATGHGQHEGHSHDDAVHAASCEAVAASVASSAAVLHTVGSVMRATCTPAPTVIHAAGGPVPATSPPLFLLHAALRI
jgi:hypothetical protein